MSELLDDSMVLYKLISMPSATNGPVQHILRAESISEFVNGRLADLEPTIDGSVQITMSYPETTLVNSEEFTRFYPEFNPEPTMCLRMVLPLMRRIENR